MPGLVNESSCRVTAPVASAATAAVSDDDLCVVFRTTRLPHILDELVRRYIPRIHDAARALGKSLPRCVEVEDLFAAGYMGFQRAVECFDPSRNVRFGTYASHQIRGRMLDWLRTCDHATRLTRENTRRLSAAEDRFYKSTGRRPTPEEVIPLLDEDPDRALRRFENGRAPGENILFPDANIQAEAVADSLNDEPVPLRALRNDLRSYLVRGLSRAEKLIITLYYYEGLSMREIGGVLDLSESRVSQMHADLIERLRARINEAELAD